MRPILLALALALPLPVAAQGTAEEPPGEIERGLRLFMDGLRDELEPRLRGLAQDTAPLLRDLQERLSGVVDDLDAYAAPEVLPNGDILIRRKAPLDAPPGDAPGEAPAIEPNADGTLDL